MHQEIEIIAEGEDKGKRLDKFLADRLSHLSRAHLQTLVRKQAVIKENFDDKLSVSVKVAEGDKFFITIPEPEPSKVEPQDIPLTVVFEDEELIVINKPAGLCVHPGPGNLDGTLVNALLHHCKGNLSGIGGVERPGIVHRLDKDTSGLLVCAKTQAAHFGLAEQFAAHGADGKLQRKYLALVWGKPPPGPEIIDAALGRHPMHRRKMSIRRQDTRHSSREAQTEFRLLERIGDKASLLSCRLMTGRTHQIRVHLLSRGWAVVGDKTYALRKNNFAEAPIDRQALHAEHLGFIHPATGEALAFNAPPPADFQDAIKKLRETYPLLLGNML